MGANMLYWLAVVQHSYLRANFQVIPSITDRVYGLGFRVAMTMETVVIQQPLYSPP